MYRGLCPKKPLPAARYAAVRTLYDPRPSKEEDILDSNALVLHFPAPKTVTGEDVLELHVHGGSATVRAVLAAIPECAAHGAVVRYAEAGEFTKRAFVNDRLDLAQVESLGDTLAAETEQQRRAAVRGNAGKLGRTYEGWREQLLLARGELEALIDFSEDQHFDESPAELLGNVTALVRDMLRAIDVHQTAGQRSELLRKGIRIALVGPPNAGKSSLMNLIVGREASIVSTEAGTTRDVVEASLDIRGYLCTFADTAGFRSSPQPGEDVVGAVEREGIRRAKHQAEAADIVVVLASLERDAQSGRLVVRSDPETLQLASKAEACVIALNKRDAAAGPDDLNTLAAGFGNAVLARHPNLFRGAEAVPLLISCAQATTGEAGADSCRPADRGRPPTAPPPGGPHTDAESVRRGGDPGGIEALVRQLVACFGGLTSLPPDLQDLLAVTERQRQLLARCRGHLEDFAAEAAQQDADIVLAAEHLRYAALSLARITGRGDAGDVEEVLGVIFEKWVSSRDRVGVSVTC